MLNEGIIGNNARTLVKSEMIKQLHQVREVTPESWERRVFTALTGHTREEVDWDFEDNHAGYYTWIKAFDGLIEELIGDGYVKVVEHEEGARTLVATTVDPPIGFSYVTYPTRSS